MFCIQNFSQALTSLATPEDVASAWNNAIETFFTSPPNRMILRYDFNKR